MRPAFERLMERVLQLLEPGEDCTLYLEAEHSDFVRLNAGRVRQAGTVLQGSLRLDLMRGPLHVRGEQRLSGEPGRDAELAGDWLRRLRAILTSVPGDPYLLFSRTASTSRDVRPGRLPEPAELVASVTESAQGLDLAGHCAVGRIFRGFAGSAGQDHWFESDSFNLDWSVYHRADKAVKGRYAGRNWDPDEIARRIDATAEQLQIVGKPPRTLRPGRYRAYLAPAALAEVLGVPAWNGFSLRALRTRQTPLLRLADGETALHRSVHIAEHAAQGNSARFTPEAFELPARVDLVVEGQCASALADARSAREFDVPVNCAEERPHSLEMAPGAESATLTAERVGEGLLLSDLWYANLSDLAHCRVTGMSRYACLWVENGRAVAPIEPMRFDVSLYDLLGPKLLGLTREREFLSETATYEQRSTVSALLPGIFVKDFPLTL